VKGLKIYRAKVSNAIDIYALLKEANKEGVLPEKPSERLLQQYYFTGLLQELQNPYHLWFIGRRGRGFLGLVHGILAPNRWGGAPDLVGIDLIFVTKNRRKSGIGRKLLDEVKKEAENIGITHFEFLSTDEQVVYWEKERGAKKVLNLMRV
jgi:GNAT superfamily N-acetyltransferase